MRNVQGSGIRNQGSGKNTGIRNQGSGLWLSCDLFRGDCRDRSIGACLSRLIARIKARLTHFERRAGTFRVGRGEDGYDYISPTPSGADPMGKRRAR